MRPLERLALAAALMLAPCAGAQTPVVSEHVIPASYPEGPLWRGDRLFYAEMGADRISVYENGRSRAFFTQRGCGPTAIAPYGEGFLVLCHIGARVVSIDAHGAMLHAWGRDENGHRLRDPNDAYADGRGGVFFSDPGAFSKLAEPEGYVMHLSAEGRLTRASGVLWYPNGVYVDAGRQVVYVDEHMTGRVLQYDLARNGALTNQRIFVDINRVPRPQRYEEPYRETGCDGLEMSADGDLWVSIYGEGRILRFSPQGRLVGMLEEPTRYLTNIAFNARGDAATTGAFDNDTPPFPGQVRIHPASSLTRRPE